MLTRNKRSLWALPGCKVNDHQQKTEEDLNDVRGINCRPDSHGMPVVHHIQTPPDVATAPEEPLIVTDPDKGKSTRKRNKNRKNKRQYECAPGEAAPPQCAPGEATPPQCATPPEEPLIVTDPDKGKSTRKRNKNKKNKRQYECAPGEAAPPECAPGEAAPECDFYKKKPERHVRFTLPPGMDDGTDTRRKHSRLFQKALKKYLHPRIPLKRRDRPTLPAESDDDTETPRKSATRCQKKNKKKENKKENKKEIQRPEVSSVPPCRRTHDHHGQNKKDQKKKQK